MIRKQKGATRLIIEILTELRTRLDLILRIRRPHEKLREIILSTKKRLGINNKQEDSNTILDIKEMDDAYNVFQKVDVLDLSANGNNLMAIAFQNYNEKIGRIET